MDLWQKLKQKHGYTSLFDPRIGIGIPTINRADLLKQNLEDLSTKFGHKLHKLVIVDNGQQNIEKDIPAELISNTIIYNEPENLGVAASWNKIIKTCYYQESPVDHIIMLNDDIVFGKDYNDVLKIVNEYPNYTFLNANYFWAVFMISKDCVDDVGYFDENFFPAYFEDNDYARRMSQQYGHIEARDRKIIDSLNPIVKRNSSSIQKNAGLNSRYSINSKYYFKKWGGTPGHERFEKPFDGGPTPPRP